MASIASSHESRRVYLTSRSAPPALNAIVAANAVTSLALMVGATVRRGLWGFGCIRPPMLQQVRQDAFLEGYRRSEPQVTPLTPLSFDLLVCGYLKSSPFTTAAISQIPSTGSCGVIFPAAAMTLCMASTSFASHSQYILLSPGTTVPANPVGIGGTAGFDGLSPSSSHEWGSHSLPCSSTIGPFQSASTRNKAPSGRAR